MTTLQVFDEFKHLKVTPSINKDAAIAPKVQGELQIWLREVLQAGRNEALTRLLRGGPQQNNTPRVTSVINQANALIAAAFPQLSPKAAQKSRAKPRGLATSPTLQAEDTSRKRMLCLSLYKFCLHRVLLLSLEGAAASLKLGSVPEVPDFAQQLAIDSVLENPEMLAGLVQACAEIVNYAHLTNVSESFPTCSLRMARKTQWLELLQGLTWLRHARKELAGAGLEEGRLPGLLEFPMPLQEYILAMENKILSELLFVPGSTFYPRVQEHGIYKFNGTDASAAKPLPMAANKTAPITPEDVKNGMKRTANTIVLSTTLKKFCRLAEQKARALCHHLWTCSGSTTSSLDETSSKQLESALQDAVSAMVNTLLYRHLDLMYNRHLTVIVIGIVCCTAKICGFKVKFPAVMKVAMYYFDYEDADALSEVSLDPMLSMKCVKKKKEKNGICSDESDEEEEDQGWSSSSSDEDSFDHYNEKDQATFGAVGSAKEFYNQVMVPLVTLYVNNNDGSVPELLGSTQEVVLKLLENSGVTGISLDASKLYAKGGGGGGTGPSQQTAITTTGVVGTRRNQSQSQQQSQTPPSNLLNVSSGGGGGRNVAKKPGSRTPLAALKPKKKNSNT